MVNRRHPEHARQRPQPVCVCVCGAAKGLRADAEDLNDEVSDLKKEINKNKVAKMLEKLKAVSVDKKEVGSWWERNGMNGFGVQIVGNNNKTMIQSFTTVTNSTINI